MANLLQAHGENAMLLRSLTLANDMTTKGYLEKLSVGQLAPLTAEDKDILIDENTKFFNLTKLVVNKNEKLLEQLATITDVAYAVGGSIVTIIKSDGKEIDFYIGLVIKNFRGADQNSQIKVNSALQAFEGALQGNLVGSELTPLSAEYVNELQQQCLSRSTAKAICAISGVPAFRDEVHKDLLSHAQGIEHMLDALHDKKYTIISIADPIVHSEIAQMKQGYELIYSQLATFLKQEVTVNETNSYTLSATQTQSISDSITKGVALTQTKAKTEGHSSSIDAGISVSFFVGANFGASTEKNSSQSNSWGESRSENVTNMAGLSNTRSVAAGKSTGNSLQLSYENRSVKSLLAKIDAQLERLEVCENTGAFSCATYVTSEDRSVALAAASNFNAVVRGQAASLQTAYINSWYKETHTKQIADYLKYFTHPKFSLETYYPSGFEGELRFTPAVIMTEKEATMLMGIPRQSVAGLPVVEMTPFGRNIDQKLFSDRKITLGNLHHMSQDQEIPVILDCQSLAAHTFVTGSTGAGKSNLVYQLLEEVQRHQIKFLVIEPAKGEYKHVFGNQKDVMVFGTNSLKTPLLRINPFRFPADIHVLEHIDRLIEIFNVCWPMYAAMPAVLKEAVEKAYVVAGWDLRNSVNYYDAELFPTFPDLLTQLTLVISESAFSQEVKSNYMGALVTRIKSLTNGINGEIFTSNEIDSRILFDSNVIVDISRVASIETKAMIMGILLMRLQEYRIAEGGMGKSLRHITVLEEAHNLLKLTSTEQFSEGANLLGKSVEMLSNAIAEMRTYGEGFIIVDQSPNMLDLSAIRNTNTKIILRLPDLADRELVGRAAGLNDGQIAELAKLPTGIAAVYQNNWLEPVLCHIHSHHAEPIEYKFSGNSAAKDTSLEIDVIQCLLGQALKENVDIEIDFLKDRVRCSNLAMTVKSSVLEALKLKKETNFSIIAPAICGLLRGEELITYARIAKNIDEWNHLLLEKVHFPVMTLEEKYQSLVLFCFVSERYKTTDTERLDSWLRHMEGRLF